MHTKIEILIQYTNSISLISISRTPKHSSILKIIIIIIIIIIVVVVVVVVIYVYCCCTCTICVLLYLLKYVWVSGVT